MSTNELIILENLNPVELFQNNGLEPLLTRIETECRSVLLDISTEDGRNEIDSLFKKIRRSKNALDDMGKGLGEEWRVKVNALNAERNKAKDRLQSLMDEIRKPLTDFENAEKTRIDGHEAVIRKIEELFLITKTVEPEKIHQSVGYLTELMNRDWQEFDARAKAMARKANDHLNDMYRLSKIAIAEQEEIKAFEKAEQERLQKERDERIATDATAKAIAEAEARIKAAEVQAENAARIEREHIEREKILQAQQQAAREQDQQHRTTINNAALDAISAVITRTESTIIADMAKAIVVAIAKKQIPNVDIRY
jgi:hypothetical protein